MAGGGLGTGAGGLLGTLAGVALAPETGGLSMAIPAVTGAAGAELGNVASGNQVNPLMAAVMGGIGGGLGGASGLGDALGIGDGLGLGAEDTAATDIGTSAAGASGVGASGSQLTPGTQSFINSLPGAEESSLNPQVASQLGIDSGSSGGTSMLGKLGNYVASNPLKAALAGNVGLSAIQSLLPHPQVNVGQNAANVMATNPSFNAALPKYTMQNTATPYSGNWYTYGETPQTAMYNAQPQAAKHGGMIKGYAHGGKVHGYAMGGMPPVGMPPQGNMPPASPPQAPMPPQGMPPRPPMAAQQPVNPLMLKAAHNIGFAIGKHLKNNLRTPAGQVHGKGGGQDDAVPARLSQGEFITPADVVAHLGDGSSNEGAKKLTEMNNRVRAHKTSKGNKFPPKAKNPLSYLKGKA
jgi:hypothetical protein